MKTEIKFQKTVEDEITKAAEAVAELAFDVRFAGASLELLMKIADAIQALTEAAKLAKEEGK